MKKLSKQAIIRRLIKERKKNAPLIASDPKKMMYYGGMCAGLVWAEMLVRQLNENK